MNIVSLSTNAARLAAAGTATCSGIRADVPSAAKQLLPNPAPRSTNL